jgi:NitT/TauT family transport system substrate-binding protein
MILEFRASKPALWACLSLLLLGSVACSSSGSATNSSNPKQQVTTVTVGVSGATGTSAPVFIGVEAGVFKRYGLDVKVNVLTPTSSSAAVASGSVDIGGDGSNMVAAILKGNSGKVIFTNGHSAFEIATKANITSIGQLRGKTIAATTPGGGADTTLRAALTQQHLVPDKDVKITYVNQNSASLASVANGKVDAAVVSPPTSIQAEKKLGLKLIDISQYALPSVYAVNATFAAQHKDTVIKFVQAYAAATKLAATNENAAIGAFKKDLGITDVAQLDGTWQAYRALWEAAPYPVDAMKETLAGLNPASSADPASVIDNQYIDAIGQSSWVTVPASGG